MDITNKFMTLPVDNFRATHAEIAKEYMLSGWLFFDLLASFPFMFIFDISTAKWFTLVRIIKFGGIWKFFSW
jgi:hypothetical protein